MGELLFVLYLGSSIWVYFDARQLKAGKGRLKSATFDMGPAGWFFSCLLLWILAFPIYLSKRAEYKAGLLTAGEGSPPIEDPTAQLERLATLKDKGILSEEEFETKKADLLSRI